MAKKSQTRARRNNTQVGPQVVNFYNHGTVNVDARQNNSTSPKYNYSGCTFNYAQSRPFTIEDQIDPTHPIFSQIDENVEAAAITEVIPVEGSTKADDNIQDEKETSSKISKFWSRIAIAGLATAVMLSIALIHNQISK